MRADYGNRKVFWLFAGCWVSFASRVGDLIFGSFCLDHVWWSFTNELWWIRLNCYQFQLRNWSREKINNCSNKRPVDCRVWMQISWIRWHWTFTCFNLPFQDILREKTNHLEQLIKERENVCEEMSAQEVLHQKSLGLVIMTFCDDFF